jgi:alkylation response protein AidB-like acyl-CoA dehydrogenase
MDLELSEEQQAIVEAARGVADRLLVPRARARDEHESFPVEELGELARLGLLGVNVPEALGGSAAGAVAYALAMMEIARADASVSVAMSVTNMAAELICQWGNEAQHRQHVTRLVDGRYLVGAFALSEPQAGSDPAGMGTTARQTERGWVLSGTKQWITSATHAGLFVVWARTSAAAGSRGLSAFLVEKGTPGLVIGRAEDKMGLRGSSTCQLILDDCELAAGAILGKVGDGFKIAMTALDGGRIGIASQAVGIARAAIDASVTYARTRVQFGAPIARLQAIQNMLADMETWQQAARLMTLHAAWRKQARLPFTLQASMAKLYASERAGKICDQAVQIHGGYGYTREFAVERFMRDSRVNRIYEGTSEVQRIVIAREVLKGQGG